MWFILTPVAVIMIHNSRCSKWMVEAFGQCPVIVHANRCISTRCHTMRHESDLPHVFVLCPRASLLREDKVVRLARFRFIIFDS